MSIITSGSFTKALWPGVNAWYGAEYDEFPVEWKDMYDSFTSRKAFEEDVGVSGFGLLQVKPAGQSIAYDTAVQAFINRYTHIRYALGFVVTKEAFDDDQYDVIGEKNARSLAFSVRQTYETLAAVPYNLAFSSTKTYGDGVSLLNSAHPNAVGGTWSNIPSVAANLSEAALEQAVIDIAGWQNDRGLKINVMPKTLIIPYQLAFEAERILKTQYRVGTANNDINALISMGKFPGGVSPKHYLTSSTAWFLRTNIKDGMKYFEREAPKFDSDNDWDTDNAKFKTSFRACWGATDPRGLYGSAGF